MLNAEIVTRLYILCEKKVNVCFFALDNNILVSIKK